jgi:hypothetical protein
VNYSKLVTIVKNGIQMINKAKLYKIVKITTGQSPLVRLARCPGLAARAFDLVKPS